MADHSPEPWRIAEVPAGGQGIIDRNHRTVLSDPYVIRDENKHRVVACVNACTGIPEKNLPKVHGVFAAQRVAQDVHNEILQNLIPSARNIEDFVQLALGIRCRVSGVQLLYTELEP